MGKMGNFLVLLFLLSVYAVVLANPASNTDYNNAVYPSGNYYGGQRAYPQYYYYPDGGADQQRRQQGEIMDTSHRVYSPIFRYRKKESKLSKPPKRTPYPYRKPNRIMPAYLI